MSKIGIFSGSFDPIHTGHAMIANYISQWGGVDEVWLMVSPQNPLKEHESQASESDRLAMVGLVAEDCSNVKASDFEFGLPLPTYTYRTLCLLKEHYPRHEFTLVIGSDNWEIFGQWRDSEKIISEFGIIIYPRPGHDVVGDLPEGVKLMKESPQALISSTFVRESLKEGKNLNYFLPVRVYDYVKRNGLYHIDKSS